MGGRVALQWMDLIEIGFKNANHVYLTGDMLQSQAVINESCVWGTVFLLAEWPLAMNSIQYYELQILMQKLLNCVSPPQIICGIVLLILEQKVILQLALMCQSTELEDCCETCRAPCQPRLHFVDGWVPCYFKFKMQLFFTFFQTQN